MGRQLTGFTAQPLLGVPCKDTNTHFNTRLGRLESDSCQYFCYEQQVKATANRNITFVMVNGDGKVDCLMPQSIICPVCFYLRVSHARTQTLIIKFKVAEVPVADM